MTDRTVWGANLQELLQNVAGNGSIYLSEIESDLLQINLLLMEAINKLGDNVVQIGQDVHRQQKLVKQLTEAGSCLPFALERLDELNQTMDTSVNSVVTAMQFQDMTGQLLDKVLSRVRALQGMIEEMDKLAVEVSGAESEGDIQMMIRAMGEEMNNKRRELEGLHAQQVSQKHMESGSIELF
jgi:small-conductance mechanosensitive channel